MAVFIANVLFDSQQRILKEGNQSRSLEPKVFSLLTCLLAANGQIVTRDQLLAIVWDNRIVGEGAINRTVSLLRAHFLALTDNEVIETVPTQGYRLIAEVTEFIEPHTTDIKSATENSPTLLSKLSAKSTVITTLFAAIFVLILVLTIAFSHFFKNENVTNQDQLSLINDPLIGLKGLEYQLSATESGQQVLFHHLDGMNQQSVYLYDTLNHSKEKILTDALAMINATGERIVYTNFQNKQCEISLYHVTTQQKQSLFACDEPPATLIWGENDTFYFNKRFSKSHPYQVFSYHIKTKQLQQLTNPNGKNNTKGDFRFTYNSQTKQLAIARYINENKTKIVIYQEDQQVTEHTVNLRIRNLIWHPNKRDLVIADYTNLYLLTTDDSQLQLLKQLTFRINSLAVVPYKKGDSLLVSSANITSDVVKYDLTNGLQEVWQTSARAELLPRMQGDTQLILSTRYQSHHLWKIDNNEASLIDIELPFDLKFIRYELSNNGQHVLFSKHGAMYELNIDKNSYQQLFKEPTNSYVANYDSRNEKNIIYSSNHSGQWQLWLYQRASNTHSQLTKNGGYSGRVFGQYLYYSKYTTDGLWRKKLSEATEELVIEDFNRINWLNWQIINNQLYFYREASGIWQFDINTSEEQIIMKKSDNFIHQYTVSPDQQYLFWVRLKPVEGDIYQYELLD